MKNLQLNSIAGNFSNQLYFILHAFVLSKKYNEQVKYTANNECNNLKLNNTLQQLNVNDYFQNNIDNNSETIDEHPIDYLQKFNIDFTEDELNEFIYTTIFQSEKFAQYKQFRDKILSENAVALHIRNGDYLILSQFNCFNRQTYLIKTLQYANANFSNEKIYVFSDDNTTNRQLYDSILKKNFKTIEYIDNNTQLDDLMMLSQFKYKILWNSTFSYWSAFISNCIYMNNFRSILVPSAFLFPEQHKIRCNPKWTIIDTPYNK